MNFDLDNVVNQQKRQVKNVKKLERRSPKKFQSLAVCENAHFIINQV